MFKVKKTTRDDRTIEVELYQEGSTYPWAWVSVQRWGKSLTLSIRVTNGGCSQANLDDDAAAAVAAALLELSAGTLR